MTPLRRLRRAAIDVEPLRPRAGSGGSAAFGVTASWVGGALLAAALVSLALLVPALRNYDANARPQAVIP